MTTHTAPPFVPPHLDPADWGQLQPLYDSLLRRPIHSTEDLERWLMDMSALDEHIDEAYARRMIDHTCHTDDAAVEKRFLDFVEKIIPLVRPMAFELQKKFAANPHHEKLDPGQRHGYFMLARSWKNAVEIFRVENIPLDTQATKLVTQYNKILGAMLVEFRGKQYTLQQLARFTEEPDRATRQEAWRLAEARRLQDRDAVDGIFGELLDLRQKMAVNTGMTNYRDLAWKGRERFDYTPRQCLQFGDAVAAVCVPLVEKLDARRKKTMGLDTLRPWDLSVDAMGRPALRPFAEDRVEDLVERTRQSIHRVSPDLGAQFATLKPGVNLDLESRIGKKPGGYQCSLEASRQTFIFMNAAGLQRDVETLIHEAGHAFHYLAARDLPLVFTRSAPMEFCEVASMSMELLTADHLDSFYNPADAARAKRALLEGVVRILPWIATIDGFQHWLYTHPGHGLAERTDAWLKTIARFGSRQVDWTGLDDVQRSKWHRQGHLFGSPFYYIEYGIAQLGALQLWQIYKEDPERAVNGYRAALRLGGTRPLPELFEAAGIEFDFSEARLGPLVATLEAELDSLPE